MNPLYWSIILIVVGLGVVVLELFLPSAGMLGVLAAVLILSGIVTGFLADFYTGAFILLATAMALPALLVSMLKIWPHTPIGRSILLDEREPHEVLPDDLHSKDLIGQLGIAKTKMLPSGIILVDGKKLDAISNGFAIEMGDAVKITKVRGNLIHVEPYEGEIEDPANLPVRDRNILDQPFEDLDL